MHLPLPVLCGGESTFLDVPQQAMRQKLKTLPTTLSIKRLMRNGMQIQIHTARESIKIAAQKSTQQLCVT